MFPPETVALQLTVFGLSVTSVSGFISFIAATFPPKSKFLIFNTIAAFLFYFCETLGQTVIVLNVGTLKFTALNSTYLRIMSGILYD